MIIMGEVYYKGAMGMNGVTGNTNSWYFFDVLDEGLITADNE